MTEIPLRVVCARPEDLARYIDLLEGLADWLDTRGIRQWPRGYVRGSSAYYAASIDMQEVQLAFVDRELAGTLRLLMHEPIVWPEIVKDDGVCVYNLGVHRAWAGHGLGRRLLAWAENRAVALGRQYVRLDCLPDNMFLRRYYEQAGFVERGEVDAPFPDPVGTLRLRRYEKQVAGPW